jgi:hypothetical protein
LGYQVKNLFELKLGDRVLVQNNTFENNWTSAQNGYAILLRSTDQSGTAPWSDVSNVTFQQNVIENSTNGINLDSELGTAVGMSNININNNLLYNIGGSSGGTLFQILGYQGVPIQNLSITNNTGILPATAPTTGEAVMFDAETSSGGNSSDAVNGLVFSNNVLSNGLYGIFGSGQGTGNAALSYFAPGGSFSGNVLIGGSAGSYSSYPGNYFPTSVSFVNPSTGNYNLTNPSLYDNGNAGDQFIDPPGAPTVTITSTGGSVTSSALTITGTVDAADNGSTVKIFDGSTQIGTTVAANGVWSDNVTLANQGVNVLTATDANAYGPGISKTVTYTLQSAVSSVIDRLPVPASMADVDLLASELLTFKRTQEAGLAGTQNYPQLAKSSKNWAALLTSDGGLGSYNLSPAWGEAYPLSGLNIAASPGEIGSAGSRAL